MDPSTLNRMRLYWENCGASYAHLTTDKGRGLEPGSQVRKLYEEVFLNKVDFQGKTVLDYGIGGGWLGKLLFETKDIYFYVGVDIAERSLATAMHTLQPFGDRCNFALTPVEFGLANPDIIVCLACIQHFPNEDYLLRFLENCERSGAKTLILQIRYSNKNKFSDAYKTDKTGDVGLACETSFDFISQKLPSYFVKFTSQVMEGSRYQYGIYERNS